MSVTKLWIKRLLVSMGLAFLFFVPSCLSPIRSSAPSDHPGFKVALLQDRIFSDTVIAVENPLLVNPTDQKIHLYGAGGESVFLQVVIPAGQDGPLFLQIDPLAPGSDNVSAERPAPSAIEPACWRVFHVLYVPVKTYDAVYARLERPELSAPRVFPDPLVEITRDTDGRFPVPASSGENTVLLLELAVPRQVPAAEYSGRMALQSPGKDFVRVLNLRRWRFDLPDPGVSIFGIVNAAAVWSQHELGTLRDRDHLILPPDLGRCQTLGAVLERYGRILDENGVEPWLSNVYPRLSGADSSNPVIDWRGYRVLVEAILKSASRGRQYWPIPLDLSYPPTRTFGPYNSSIYRRVLSRYLAEMNEQILGAGLAGRGVAALAWVNNYRQALELYPSYVDLAEEVHRSDGSIPIVDPFIRADFRPLGWTEFKPFDGLVKTARILCPVERWLDASTIGAVRRQGGSIWWRPTVAGGSVPMVSLAYPGYFAQALPWVAFRYGSQGIVLEQVNGGRDGEVSPRDESWSWESPGLLIYPGRWFGRDGALGSLRLKMIKAGLQDLSYLRVLDRAGKRESVEWLTRHLVRYAHTDALEGSFWSMRNDGLAAAEPAWALARLIAGLESQGSEAAATTQPSASEQMQIQRKLLTGQFRDLTEGLALEVEGVRARNILDVQTGTEKIEWTFHAVVRNFTDTDGEAWLQFLNVSPPLTPVETKVALAPLGWAWPVRAELKLQSPAVALGFGGVNDQSLALRMKDGTEIVLNCRYAALATLPLESPVEVDGQFDDWPESPGAVAGNFQRIRPDGINAKRWGSAPPAASWPTTVKVGFTRRNLYWAVTCHQPREGLVIRHSNTIGSSAALPWGEDFIEIQIDPDNTRSFNPRDVYHLIIKANGTCLGFRGTVDPTSSGSGVVWFQGARSAVRVFDDRWQAEVSVPLSDVGGVDKLNRWWGMDFVRFVAAGSEMSAWSGTKNPSGKPLSLGNVFLSRPPEP